MSFARKHTWRLKSSVRASFSVASVEASSACENGTGETAVSPQCPPPWDPCPSAIAAEEAAGIPGGGVPPHHFVRSTLGTQIRAVVHDSSPVQPGSTEPNRAGR